MYLKPFAYYSAMEQRRHHHHHRRSRCVFVVVRTISDADFRLSLLILPCIFVVSSALQRLNADGRRPRSVTSTADSASISSALRRPTIITKRPLRAAALPA